jgi:hypothetical protein
MEMEGGMTVAPVPYDNFVQSPLGFLEDGGAWTFDNRSSSSRHMIFGGKHLYTTLSFTAVSIPFLWNGLLSSYTMRCSDATTYGFHRVLPR